MRVFSSTHSPHDYTKELAACALLNTGMFTALETPVCHCMTQGEPHQLGCERSDQGKINQLQRQLRKDNYMDRSVIKEPLFKSEFLKSIRQVLRILQMSGLDSLPCHKPSGGTPRVGKGTGYRKRRVDGVGVRVS